MKTYKVIIEYENQILEIYTEAKFYSEAYIAIEIKYPGCIIRSLLEVRKENNPI
jgi:hypothetical protein